MAITTRVPNTIHIAGPLTIIDEHNFPAGGVITPGDLVEMYDDSGTTKWRRNSSSTEQVLLFIALDRPESNKGIDDDYAAGDNVKASAMSVGSVWYMQIPSGQNISNGELMQSAGTGKLITASATTATANLAKFQSLTNAGAVTALTRIKVQVIQ